MAYWDRRIQDGYKIAATWQGTMNLITKEGRPHVKPIPQTLHSMEKKTLYGFLKKPPNTWKRLILPLPRIPTTGWYSLPISKEGVMGVLDSLHNANDPFSENICKASSCFPPEPCTQDFKDLSGAAPFILQKTRCGR
ncbi:hypothetical protein Hypma_009843 [Hypsizygus marmoreus]|uniref:Uncharacterized protein n=1 Tax=Hypsizygus marmoreus TaxID=39966 RepID=A0A369JNK1_HYPMA|nr:hypothetical protein Hypma_009843 [Hypsizygus marmoreus]